MGLTSKLHKAIDSRSDRRKQELAEGVRNKVDTILATSPQLDLIKDLPNQEEVQKAVAEAAVNAAIDYTLRYVSTLKAQDLRKGEIRYITSLWYKMYIDPQAAEDEVAYEDMLGPVAEYVEIEHPELYNNIPIVPAQ